jgi:phage anti-repressor protein
MPLLSFKDFLKKYSTLSNEFIDNFYNVYNFNEYDNNDFIINIQAVSKLLGLKIDRIKEILINGYKKNTDYKISKSNKEIILLTPDCFKRLCLLSKTKKAEEVRTYYIELEKLLNNYKDYVIEGLKKTVKILENNQKEIPKTSKGDIQRIFNAKDIARLSSSQALQKSGVIYILKSPKDIDGIYRFGKTENFKNRLTNYNSSNSDKMEIVMIYETKDIEKIEACVITQIKELRYKKRKDFYQININLLKKIISECESLTLKYKKRINKNKNNNDQQGGGNIENLYMYIEKINL